MRIRCIWVILAVVLVPAIAQAHIHNADASGALSFDFSSMLVGGHGQIGVTFPKPDSYDFGLLLDVSARHGKHEGEDVTRVGFMGGVRWMFESVHPQFVPSAHVLVGILQDGGLDKSDADIAVAIGGSWDLQFNQDPGGWGARLILDYVISGVDHFPRFSAGLSYRFGPRKTP